MKNILIFCLLLIGSQAFAQTEIIGGSGVCHVDGDPDLSDTLEAQDSRFECQIAYDTANAVIYVYDASGTIGDRWNVFSTDTRVDTAYISSDTLRLVVRQVNDLSVVKTLKVAIPIPPTDLTFTGTTSPITLNSSTGTDVTFKDSTGIYTRATAGNLTILNTGDTNPSDDITGSVQARRIPFGTSTNVVSSSYKLKYHDTEGSITIGSETLKTASFVTRTRRNVDVGVGRAFSILIGDTLTTTAASQHLGLINTRGLSGNQTRFNVNHNNTFLAPYEFYCPPVTIAGGVTGTSRNAIFYIEGQASYFATLSLGSGPANTLHVNAGTQRAIEVETVTGSTQQGVHVFSSTATTTKQALTLDYAGSTVNTGTGISFGHRTNVNGTVRSSIYSILRNNNPATVSNAYIIETLNNGTANETARFAYNSLSVNTQADPLAVIQGRGKTTTSDGYGLIITNSTGTTTTATLAVRDDALVGIGTNAPTQELTVVGDIATNHLQGRGSAPSVTVNTTTCGTGATASVVGFDLGFVVTVTFGTSPSVSGGELFTLNYNTTLPGVGVPVFSPGDDSGFAADIIRLAGAYTANADSTDFQLWSNGDLSSFDSDVLKFNFVVIAR